MGLIKLDAFHKASLVSLGQYVVRGVGQHAAILKKYYSTATDKGLIKLAENFLAPERFDYSENNAMSTKQARNCQCIYYHYNMCYNKQILCISYMYIVCGTKKIVS